MITVGAVFSTTGNNMGQALSGSRNLFALAEQGDLPPFFGRVHPDVPHTRERGARDRRRVARAGVVRDFSVDGGSERDQPTAGLCRNLRVDVTVAQLQGLPSLVKPPVFVVPFGPLVPVAAIAIAMTILAGATRVQLRNGAVALLVGAILFALATLAQRRAD